MTLNIKKENLCINQIVGQREQTVEIEGDVIVPDIKPDILKTIDATGTLCVYKKEVLDGKVRIDGNINIYIIYLSDSEEAEIRSLNTNIDFTEIIDIDEARNGMSSIENFNIKTIECKFLNGRKIKVKAILDVNVKVFANEKIDIISELNDEEIIQVLSKEEKLSALIGEGSSKIFAKDQIHIDEIDNIAEILKVNLSIKNRENKISYNKVLSKADLSVNILYLTEDNRINSTSATISVMGFVDINNVSEDNICDTRYNIKNFIIKPNSNEQKGIYVEAQIELSCFVYELKEINIIQDLYSPQNEITHNDKKIKAISNKKTINSLCQINEKLNIAELGNNRILDVELHPSITNKKILNGKIVYEGKIDVNIIFEIDNISKIDKRIIQLDFSGEIENDGLNNENIETSIEIKQSNFSVIGNGDIDCNIQLEIQLNIENMIEINIIEDINKGEIIEKPSYSMVIYFVKSGDSLWKIAKKFKSTVHDIVKINNIENEDKIFPGMQLFIPKYYKKLV